MTVPYNTDTRETYVKRMEEIHLAVAKRHHDLGNTRSMWQQLFTWAQAEEIYGTHWDKLKEKRT